MIKQMFCKALIVGVLILLGGCSMAPKYAQPTSPIPEAWPQGEAYKNSSLQPDAVIIPELDRQEFFADESLQKIIAMALANNRDLRLAALNVERARALYGVQRAELFPAVDGGGAGSKGRLASDFVRPGESRSLEQYGVNLGIAAWEIDFFGRIRSLKDRALQEYLATEEARRSAQISLVFEVSRVYLSLAADRENLQLTDSTLETQQAAYTLIKKRYNVGLATELDLRRAQVPVEKARRNVAIFTQMVAQDLNALNLLAGAQIPTEWLPVNLSGITPPREIAPGFSSAVLLQRPDIMAAEHRLKGAYAYIGAARAAFFPRISLTSSIGSASNELSGLFSSGSGTWNFAPQIVMPIFDARVWAALRVSKADREIILTQYEKTIQTAFREVADTLAVQGTIEQQIAAQQALVEAVAETYNLSSKRYNKGVDSYLGVLDAQRSHFSAQLVLVTLRRSKLVNRIKLYAVLGGGVEPAGKL